MHFARADHIAVLLPSGKVLVAGGDQYHQTAALSSAEIYDPQTGTFSDAGSMVHAREFATAVSLPDGRVAVIGGMDGPLILASAELYDPKTGSFLDAGSLSQPRLSFGAAAIAGGRVLIAGGAGSDGNPLASCELFEP
jgi:hypothetical protein